MDPDARPEPGSPAPELRQDPHQEPRTWPNKAEADRPDQLPLEGKTGRPDDVVYKEQRTGHTKLFYGSDDYHFITLTLNQVEEAFKC